MIKTDRESIKSVLRYFEELSKIPRGSGNSDKISKYCVDFANAHSLRVERDEADNVIIFKSGTSGYENAEPIILQGHLDMVCQKTEDCDIDFENDGLCLYTNGDELRAKGTTLGADNGIAVAMILAILESNKIEHPPIEAVFTTDEEIGMIGAGKLSADSLKGKMLVNLDSEEIDRVTVSCAGGSDFRMLIPVTREKIKAEKIKLSLYGLKGGHSGVEIDRGRVNADTLMGRILSYTKTISDFDIIEVNGGDKANAIPNACSVLIATNNKENIKTSIIEYLDTIKCEIAERESGFEYSVEELGISDVSVIDKKACDSIIFTLACVPNGIYEMSAEIDGLVESSQNLGILKTEEDKIIIHFALRSNKKSALKFLEERLSRFALYIDCKTETYGHYPAWEYKENSKLQEKYKEIFKSKMGFKPQIVAIHAGLECGMFCNKIDGLDCISIGPDIKDVHTVNECLDLKSTEVVYELLIELLKSLK